MEFEVLDTILSYEKIATEMNVEKKQEIYYQELVKPFEGMFRMFGAQPDASGKIDATSLLNMWAYLGPGQIDENILDTLRFVKKYDPASTMAKTLERAWGMFEGYEHRIPIKRVVAGFFLQDQTRMNPITGDYTGFGAIPGYVTLNYFVPNEQNMSMVASTLAHELCHGICSSVAPAGFGDPRNLSVDRMVIGEGLAESFAVELCGRDKLVFCVKNFDLRELPRVKNIIKEGLNLKGFENMQRYVFGNIPGVVDDKGLGLPPHSGYAVGYYAVQAYMERTGKSIVETIFTPAEEIVRESKFFD
ncbi:DUF2268 domain-containing protein [Methanocella sp. MCL-LM]|uniref:DUF2268 domain-containing protein n=1 Tax=Methanocella sp. MCL-LM TaxID=3412035 RepID=UPI003C72CF9C